MSTLALVTGAQGWLGTGLVHALVRGLPEVPRFAQPSLRRVRCLVLPGSDTSALRALGPTVELCEGDIRDPGSLAAFFADARDATLFHCAGVIHPGLRTRRLDEVNVGGTKNVLTLAEGASVRRMVHVSSNSPLGTNPAASHVFDETAKYNPYMRYGRTKMLAEIAVQEAEARGKLETVIMRPPWFYGPHQPPRQSLFFAMIRDGRAPLVGRGDNRRSMGYIDNLCQGALLCEAVPAARGQIYWIADERPYAMTEILDTIERVMEKDFGIKVAHKRLRLPGWVARVAERADAIVQSLGFYNQKIHVLSEMNKTIACSIDKAKAELGYAPTVALEEGMRRSLAWLRERGIRW